MTVDWHKVKIAVLVIAPLIGLVVAIISLWQHYVFAKDLVVMVVGYAITVMGVNIGYHRMLTHQGFQAPAAVRGFFTILGAMAVEGQPISWVATHIKHHAHSDHDGDPHSPLDGFWHAHIGWLFKRENFPDPKRYAPHLLKDPLIRLINLYTPFWVTVSLVIPFLIGGWTGLLWGGLVRIFITTHVTWSVNSVCHTFGRRQYETTDESHNHWLVGLLAFGEGWHNNHHAFPSSAFHGLKWWQFDLSGLIIGGMEKVGLIWDVKRPTPKLMQTRRYQNETLRQLVADIRQQLETNLQQARAEISRVRSTLPDLRPFCDQSQARLDHIQNRLAHATHLKQQKLQEYLAEVRSLARRAHSAVKSRTHLQTT